MYRKCDFCLLAIFHKWVTPKTQKSEEKKIHYFTKNHHFVFLKGLNPFITLGYPKLNPCFCFNHCRIIAECHQEHFNKWFENTTKESKKRRGSPAEWDVPPLPHCLNWATSQIQSHNPYLISHNKHSKIWIKSTMASLKRGKRMLWVRSGTLASLSQLSKSTHEWATNEQIQTPI